MRRNLFLIGLVIGIALTAYFYSDVYYLLTSRSARFKAVPVESGFFFDVKGLGQLKTTTQKLKLEDKVSAIGLFEKAQELRQFFNTFDTTATNPFIKDINTEHLIVAAYPASPGMIDLTYVLQMNESSRSLLQGWLDASNATVQTELRKVRGKKVYDVTFVSDKSHWSVGFWHGLCIVSRNTALVEAALVQLKGSYNLTDDNSFRMLPSDGDAYLHLYFNYNQLSSTAQGFANDQTQLYLQSFGRFAAWTGLSFKPAENGLVVTGYTSVDESLLTLNDYQNESSYKLWSLQQKPDNSALIISTGVPANIGKNTGSFFNTPDYRKYFGWIDSEVTYVLTEPADTAYGNQSLLFLRTKSKAALKALEPLNQNSNDSLSRLPVAYRQFTINQLAPSGLPGRLLPNAFTDFTSPYYTMAGDYVVMSNSLTQLKLYLERFMDNRTMDHVNIPGMNTKSFATGSYNVFFNVSMLDDMFSYGTRSDLKSGMTSDVRAFSTFSPVYLQFTPSRKGFAVNGLVALSEQSKAVAKAGQYLWKASFDTALIITQPLGGNDVGEKQIAVQDARFVLHVLNRAGDVVWKKQLDGPVRGNIHTIDFYRNGDRQYVFATNRKLYMLDPTGDAVQNFPISFPCDAVTPLSVLEMDNGNYRYFIGCDNGLMYGYEKGGKPMAGWNPNTGAGDITRPLQHFRYRSREFLMGVTNDGWLRFFNRYGDEANKPLRIATGITPFVADDDRGFRTVQNDGTEYRLGHDGRVVTIPAPVSNVADAVLADVVLSRPGHEKIMFDGRRISIYASDSNRVKQFTLPKTTDGRLFVINQSGDSYFIGIAGTGNVWVLDNNGKVVEGFPHKGNGMFTATDLYNTGQPVLIGLVDSKTVVAYPVE